MAPTEYERPYTIVEAFAQFRRAWFHLAGEVARGLSLNGMARCFDRTRDEAEAYRVKVRREIEAVMRPGRE